MNPQNFESSKDRRKWAVDRRRFSVAITLLLVFLHVPLLRGVGGALMSEPPEGSFDAVLVLGGDHRVQTAVALVESGRADQIWLFEDRPDFVETAGILPSDVDVQRGKLVASGIDPSQIDVVGNSEADDLPDLARQLKLRLADAPNLRVLAICEALSGRHLRFVLDDVLSQRMASRVAILGLPYDRFDVERWWRSRSGLKQFFNEFCALGFTVAAGTQPRDPLPATDPEDIEAQLRRRFGDSACYVR